MSNRILVTDSLFIFDEHVKQLEDAGFEVERLDKPQASEEELCMAVKGKVGYILGGIEHITERIIQEADQLKAISFTGTDYKGFIPGWEAAKEKGIMISDAPHMNASAVAQWAFSAALAMARNLFALGRTGDMTFQTTPGFEDLKVGIVGLGSIGARAAELFETVGMRVTYWNRSEKQTGFEKQDLDELLGDSDIVIIAVSGEAGKGFVNNEMLSKIKKGAIITCLNEQVLDEDALLEKLKAGKLRAFLDFTPHNPEFQKLSLEAFYCSNESVAFNTQYVLQTVSDSSTQSMINMLTTGEDKYRVI